MIARWTAALAAGGLLGLAAAAPAAEPPPQPCDGVVQVQDPTGDSHHANTDVRRAWFHRAPDGTVRAMIEVSALGPKVDHAENDRVLWRLMFDQGGARRYVQATARPADGSATFEYGDADGLATSRSGDTTGRLHPGSPGVVEIVLPKQIAPGGEILARPVIASAEANSVRTSWFERAPGGDDPADAGDTSVGSDWRVETCAPPGQAPGGSAGGPPRVSGVTFEATRLRSRYGRTVLVRGSVAPAIGGVVVEILDEAGAVRTRLTTDAAGAFALRVRTHRSALLVARAQGLASGTLRIDTRPRVALAPIARTRGGLRLRGIALPIARGRVTIQQRAGGQWIEVGRARVRAGRFATTLRGVRQGRFRATHGTTSSKPRSIR